MSIAVMSQREKKSESMSESASQIGTQRSHHVGTSQRGSLMELNQDNQPPTIPEEGSVRQEGEGSCKTPLGLFSCISVGKTMTKVCEMAINCFLAGNLTLS